MMAVDPVFEWSKADGGKYRLKIETAGEPPHEYVYELGKQFEMEKLPGFNFKVEINVVIALSIILNRTMCVSNNRRGV